MGYRFVDPAETRIPISDGDYLIVKAQLTAGETLDLFGHMRARELEAGRELEAPDRRPGAGDRVDPLLVGIAVAVAYLLVWSLTDKAGRIVTIRDQPAAVVVSALRQLEFQDYQEIIDAIQAHDSAVKAARQEKKQPGGVTASDRIWPSHVAAAGATNG